MNQEDTYNGYEPEIDLRDFLFFILYKWRCILLVAAMFCALLSGLGIILRMNADSTVEPKKIREYKLELANYQLELANHERDLAEYQDRLVQQEIYMEESVLMRTDPYAKPTASVDIFVKLDDAEWEILHANTNIDPTDSLIKMYTSSFSSNLNWVPIEKLTGGSELYLKELLTIESDYSSNSFTISVVYSDADTAQQILNIIVEQITEKYQNMQAGISRHTLVITNASKTYSIDASLADRQKNNQNALANYERAILDCQIALEELVDKEPTEPIIIGFVKYPAIGLLLGSFLAVAFYSIAYLMDNKLHGERWLKERYGYPLLGVFPRTEKGGFLSCIDQLLGRMSGLNQKTDRDEAARRVAVNTANLIDVKGSFLVTGTVSSEKLQWIVSEITPLLAGVTLTAAANMNQDIKTLELLAECNGVILVEEKDVSSVCQIQKEHESIKALGKPVIGYILL